MSGDFLSRWSRRKIEARKGEVAPEPVAVVPAPEVSANAVVAPVETEAPSPEPLPPIESLTHESDFTPFMKAEVDPELKRRALKTLFQDPRFNVMDGLDTYIDDYSKPDPLPEGWLEKMTQFARLGDYKPPVEEEAEVSPELVQEPPDTPPEQEVMAENAPHPNGAPESELPAPESKNP